MVMAGKGLLQMMSIRGEGIQTDGLGSSGFVKGVGLASRIKKMDSKGEI